MAKWTKCKHPGGLVVPKGDGADECLGCAIVKERARVAELEDVLQNIANHKTNAECREIVGLAKFALKSNSSAFLRRLAAAEAYLDAIHDQDPLMLLNGRAAKAKEAWLAAKEASK